MISNTLSMYYLFGKNTAIWLPCIFSPMIYQHWNIYKSKYTNLVIKYSVNRMKNSLFALVLFYVDYLLSILDMFLFYQ